MFPKAGPEFIRAMCIAVSKWTGSIISSGRIIRIHGSNDHIIKCPADCIRIKDAGHLIALTHAKECVDIIRNDRI